jgi:hypothetical protein
MRHFAASIGNFARPSALRGRKEFEMTKKNTCLCAEPFAPAFRRQPHSAPTTAANTTPAAARDDANSHSGSSEKTAINDGPVFFGTAPRGTTPNGSNGGHDRSGEPTRKIDAQEFWRRLDPQ